MRKWMTLALTALLLTGVLTACGGTGKTETVDVDLKAFYDTIEETYGWNNGYMVDIEGDMLESYYPGLSDIRTEQFVAKMPMMSSVVNEMVFMQCETEDEADQVVIELAQALQGGAAPTEEAPSAAQAAGGDTNPEAKKDDGQGCKKEAQAAPAPDGNAAIDQTVAVPPEQLDPGSVPQDGLDDITPEEVAGAIDTLVQSGEITEDEADQLVQEIAGDEGAAAGAEGDVSPEEIATVLQQAVESGDLKPEDVQQVLTELEGVPAPDAAAGAAGADGAADTTGTSDAAGSAGAVAPADESKAAEARKATAQKTAGMKVLEAIQAARAQKKASAASAK